jgi:amidohydrolase
MSLFNLKKAFVDAIDSLHDEIIAISDEIHDNPEIGFQEFKACKLLTDTLKHAGFEVVCPVAGLSTAFKAELAEKESGPRVGILAEYDALPGFGHACGHNISAAAAVGAGLGLSKLGGFPGDLMIFGTPAEEGTVENAGGKVIMLDEFRSLDAAMMIHSYDANVVFFQSFNREALEITFLGQAANAGNSLDSSKGVNALEALMLFWQAVNSLRPHLKDETRVFGIITEGGVSPNIIPDRAVTRLQIRVEDPHYFLEVIDKVKNAAQGAAKAVAASVEIRKYANTYQSIIINRPLGDTFQNNLTELGLKVEPISRKGVATDMGNVSRVAPAIHPFLAITPHGSAAIHSQQWAEASHSPQAHQTALQAAKALGLTALDVFFQPGLVEEIRKCFTEAKRNTSQ